MKMAALVSGGKDSMLALYKLKKEGHEIRYLLTMEPISKESYMFHHPNIWITELISRSTGIPLIKESTQGRKEEELEDLRNLITRVSEDVDGIVTGAIASSYQRKRIDMLCKELGLESLAPLWHVDPGEMWKELLDEGFTVLITAVAAHGLDHDWLGKVIDSNTIGVLQELSERYRFHLGFEGGEAETLVLDMPLYNQRIKVDEAETNWDGTSGSYIIKKAHLEDKP